jgi:transposase
MAKTANTTSRKATRKKESVSKSRSTPVATESKAPKPEEKAKRGDSRRRARKREAIENRPVLEPNAAGIDIGAREVYVAVPPDRDEQPVRIFDTFTADLHELANWLTACGITTVAMESTGVYWIPVYEILEAHGIRPCVVNARHMKNVPGRRTDWHECQWIQFLHAVGLLRAAFRPEAEVCALRAVIRHRGELVQMAAKHVQHMHKALTQMNLQIQHVITDLTGFTGLAIVDAILEGERQPSRLAKLRDPRVKASQETIEKSLVGNWQPEHLFTLKQSRRLYAEYQHQIAECDAEIERLVGSFQPRVDPEVKPLPPDQKKNRNYAKSRKRRTRPKSSSTRKFDLRTEVYKLFGVDVTQIPGLEFLALQLFSEVGRDMSRWASAACFVSWLALCPDNDISGGRVLWRGKRSVHNRAGQLFRMAAYALDRSPTPLGDYLRRMKAKLGPKAAHSATAHKIAVIFYTMIKNQTEYDGTIWEQRDAQRRQRHTASLKRQAQRLGYKLTPIEEEAA